MENSLFKFSAQDTDLEYLCWRSKNFPVSSDLKPPLYCGIYSPQLKKKSLNLRKDKNSVPQEISILHSYCSSEIPSL